MPGLSPTARGWSFRLGSSEAERRSCQERVEVRAILGSAHQPIEVRLGWTPSHDDFDRGSSRPAAAADAGKAGIGGD